MAIEYKAFSGGKEIDGFYSGGKEIQEIWGGDTLLWRKKEEVVEEDQWWGEYDLYARFKNPAPYKRAEVCFSVQSKYGVQYANLAYGFCVRVVNGIYMVTAAAVDNSKLEGRYYNGDTSMVPTWRLTTDTGDTEFAYSDSANWDDILKNTAFIIPIRKTYRFTHGAGHLKRNRFGLRIVTNRQGCLM